MRSGLEVAGLTRRFGARAVVDGLTFTAAPGTVTGLLGPNGCGKSTTLKLLAGALVASAGTAHLDGAPLGVNQVATKAVTGFIPDVGGLFPRLSGREHLELTARLYQLREWRRRAEELLDVLDLRDAADQRAGTYSHGMSRKLSAAVALLPPTRLLLADEPFDGVDATGIDTLAELLADRAADGTCVLVTTHLLGVAETLCDSVHLMYDGRLRARVTGDELPDLGHTYRAVLGAAREDHGR
ncbi:MAG TPA: ABC transporter ATP-binding protein [Jatrophihabitans sp.]|jgi:ABC-2 type transport system ATP-binding protein|uniref:ABC transporter ATP-binding protein n=1 Tax=Jatrophihabitans sp. TaxID=1932789 RepID=UPI002E0912FD|nr:ABC transporter ATP-binding protein [Jatrophihabitans sp.]